MAEEIPEQHDLALRLLDELVEVLDEMPMRTPAGDYSIYHMHANALEALRESIRLHGGLTRLADRAWNGPGFVTTNQGDPRV